MRVSKVLPRVDQALTGLGCPLLKLANAPGDGATRSAIDQRRLRCISRGRSVQLPDGGSDDLIGFQALLVIIDIRYDHELVGTGLCQGRELRNGQAPLNGARRSVMSRLYRY